MNAPASMSPIAAAAPSAVGGAVLAAGAAALTGGGAPLAMGFEALLAGLMPAVGEAMGGDAANDPAPTGEGSADGSAAASALAGLAGLLAPMMAQVTSTQPGEGQSQAASLNTPALSAKDAAALLLTQGKTGETPIVATSTGQAPSTGEAPPVVDDAAMAALAALRTAGAETASAEPAPTPAQVPPPTAQAVAAANAPRDSFQGRKAGEAKDAKDEKVAAVSAKGGGSTPSPVQVEAAKTAEGSAGALDAVIATTAGDASAQDPAAPAAETPTAPAATAGPAGSAATTQAATNLSALQTLASVVRGAPDTVAKMAAGLIKKLEGQSTRFDLALEPHGLGKVDVSVEIGEGGKLHAALSFDTPQAAAELRARAGELRSALEQAGFDMSDGGGLSFDFNGQGGAGQDLSDQARSWAGRAFSNVITLAETAAADGLPTLQSRLSAGVDIRI